jgi:hypothetical protein
MDWVGIILLFISRTRTDCVRDLNREARVLDYVLRAVTVPGLNTQQQIEVTLEAGLRCHRLGLSRKYALFLYIAALMSADNENFGVANALVRPFLPAIAYVPLMVICILRSAMRATSAGWRPPLAA